MARALDGRDGLAHLVRIRALHPATAPPAEHRARRRRSANIGCACPLQSSCGAGASRARWLRRREACSSCTCCGEQTVREHPQFRSCPRAAIIPVTAHALEAATRPRRGGDGAAVLALLEPRPNGDGASMVPQVSHWNLKTRIAIRRIGASISAMPINFDRALPIGGLDRRRQRPRDSSRLARCGPKASNGRRAGVSRGRPGVCTANRPVQVSQLRLVAGIS
jgi:hypothetical protein